MHSPRLSRFFRSPAVLLWLVLQHAAGDWPTFQHDAQRSGWAAEEQSISPLNAGNLELKWKRHFDDQALALNSLTAPVTASGVMTGKGSRDLAYVAGSSNHLFAVDMGTGEVLWQRTFPSFTLPKLEPFFLCPNAINATPVVDQPHHLIYALASDGKLYGLDLGTGEIRVGPFQFVPPYAKAWSLNFDRNVVYTTTSPSCGGERAAIYSMDLTDGKHPVTRERLLAGGHGGGAWARGGAVLGKDGRVHVTTGDGSFNPQEGDYGNSFVAFSTPELNVLDYFAPVNWKDLKRLDLDLPSGGNALFSYQGKQLLVGGGKESVVYLLDAEKLGGEDHSPPLFATEALANDDKLLEQKGFWGTPAIWTDPSGEPWIYMTVWGDTSPHVPPFPLLNGSTPHGSILAFKVTQNQAGQMELQPAWKSNDFDLPDPPVVANGVLFALSTGENARQTHDMRKLQFASEKEWKDNLLTTGERNTGTKPAVLYALDAKTGKVLFQSGSAMESWVHFSGLAVDRGRILAVDHSSTLYCFGLKDVKF